MKALGGQFGIERKLEKLLPEVRGERDGHVADEASDEMLRRVRRWQRRTHWLVLNQKKCFFFLCVAVSGKRHCGITVEYEKGWIGRWKVRWVLKMRGVDAAQTPLEEEGAMTSKPRFLFPSQTNYLFIQCFVSNISMSG